MLLEKWSRYESTVLLKDIKDCGKGGGSKVIRSIGSRTLTALIYTPDTCVEVSAGVSCLACPVNKTSFTTRTRLNFYETQGGRRGDGYRRQEGCREGRRE